MEKLCIDVRGFSVEKKKRVQDAFFELGYKWVTGGQERRGLKSGRYGNVYPDGESETGLVHGDGDMSCAQIAHSITYPEIMRKAGMDESDPDADYEVPKSEMPVFEYTRDIQDVIESYLQLLDVVKDKDSREVIFAHLADLTDLQFKQLGGGV